MRVNITRNEQDELLFMVNRRLLELGTATKHAVERSMLTELRAKLRKARAR